MKILAIYPGRFQPFHKGHAQVYKWLKSKFGDAIIATSDKVEAPKSPFNFKEKKKMMTLAGVPSNHIKQVSNPYVASEILKDFDPKTTVLIFAVSQKDMDEDPRFNFAPTKTGKQSYLQPYSGNEKKLKAFGDIKAPKGYVIVTPTFTFDVLGKPATSASELRKQFVSLDDTKQKAFIKDLFGKYDASVHELMKEKIGAMQPKPKTIKQLKESFNIGLTLSRQDMPQIGAASSFAKYLKDNEIGSKRMRVDPNDLKSSQMDFDYNKIEGLRQTPSKNPIVISNDNHVIDGHHRWLADKLENRSCDAYVCDLPVLDLLHHAKIYTKQINEELSRKELAPMLDSFVSFASDKLGIKSMPTVRYKNDEDDYNSFAAYNPTKNEMSISTVNRHPMDIFRSIAHELVHHKQNEDGKLGHDIAKEGATGSPTENEANSEAGKIMRWFAKANPDMFNKSYVVEEIINEGINDPGKLKAIFLAGGPGSGKDFVMNKVLAGNGLREINSDVAFEYLMKKNGLDLEMPDEERVERDIVRGRAKKTTMKKELNSLTGRLGLIINSTADDLEKIKSVKSELEDLGYDTMMVFVNTSNEVSRQRNVERGKMGMRKVPDGTDKQGVPDNSPNIRQEKWDLAQQNLGELQKIFGKDNFTVVDNTADIRKVSPEQKEKIETNFNMVRRMAMQFTQSPIKNKRGNDWVARRARYQGTTNYVPPKSLTQIKQQKPIETPKAIIKPDNDLMNQARRLGLSYYGFGRFGRKVNGVNKVLFHSIDGKLVRVQTMNEEKKMKNPCWKGYEAYGMKNKNGREVPNCVPANESFEKFMQSMGNKKLKPKKKSLNQEAMGAPEPWGPNFGTDGIGPTFPVSRAGTPMGAGLGGSYSMGMSESIQNWMHSEKTQNKFASKYGNLWEEKLIEAALRLEDSGCGCEHSKVKKSVKKVREGNEGGVNMMGTVSSQRKSDDINETISKEGNNYVVRSEKTGRNLGSSPTRAGAVKRLRQVEYFKHMKESEEQLNERGADSKGFYRSTESGAGLTAKGAKHFGIKTAVTTPPSKLKKGSKAAKRRKSFCARMGGMKGPMKDKKGRPTRKAMSLRRWNCEE